MKLEEIYVLVLGQVSKWWTDQINDRLLPPDYLSTDRLWWSGYELAIQTIYMVQFNLRKCSYIIYTVVYIDILTVDNDVPFYLFYMVLEFILQIHEFWF